MGQNLSESSKLIYKSGLLSMLTRIKDCQLQWRCLDNLVKMQSLSLNDANDYGVYRIVLDLLNFNSEIPNRW